MLIFLISIIFIDAENAWWNEFIWRYFIFDEMLMFKTPKIRWIHCVGGGVYSIHFVKSVCSSSQQYVKI